MRVVNSHGRLLGASVLVIAVFLMSACTVAPVAKPRYFWPPFSDHPKLEYLEFIQADNDVRKRGTSVLESAVFGQERPKSLFFNPFDVYAAGDGKLFVTEIGRQYVLAVDLQRGTFDKLKDAAGAVPEIKLPTGIDGDSQGNVYVIDSLAHKLLVFGPDNRLRDEWSLDPAILRPANLAVDEAHHRIYLVDLDQHAICILDQRDGSLRSCFGKRGKRPGEFNFPLDVDLDAEGNIYVLDAMNARVQVFSPEGSFLREFGERGTAAGSFQIPKGIAVSPAGQVYVTDSLAHRMVIFSLAGDYLMTVGGKFIADSGQVAPGGFYLPAGIDVDDQNGIWVVDTLNRMVHHFQYLDERYLQLHPVLPGQAVRPPE